MNNKNIDTLNIVLIFLSLYLAFKLPFELFLFSYAVLGPLHYLTEINWLKNKNFFIKEKKWVWVFVLVSIIITVPPLLNLPAFSALEKYEFARYLSQSAIPITSFFISIALLFAIGLVYFKKWQHVLLFLIITSIISALVSKYVPSSYLLFAIFVPTLIHVYLFTLFFMVYGTVNNKSKSGVIAIVFLLLCPFIILISKINPVEYNLAETTLKNMEKSGFFFLNLSIQNLFGSTNNQTVLAMTATLVKIQIFIAFSYTYHYLNWFSKTTVIGWSKNISRLKLIAIVFFWTLSVFLYYYDYKVAFTTLLFLSYLHLIVEFPLNITTMKGVFLKIIPIKNKQ